MHQPPVARRFSLVRGSAALLATFLGAAAVLVGCDKPTPPPPSPVVAPPAPPVAPSVAPVAADAGAPKSKLAPAPTDGLSLAERLEKRQADEARLATQLAADEHKRLLQYDKKHLKEHKKIFAFILASRKAYDGQKTKEGIAKLQAKMQKPLEKTAKEMAKIDPKGGNSNVLTDYDVMLNALANDYPGALMAALDGEKAGLDEQRQEMDKRTKKVSGWLAELQKAK